MAKRSLDIVIKARDQASNKFRKVGGAASGMGKMLKGAGVAALAYFGARAIKDFVGSSMEAFGRQEAAVKSLSDALGLLGQNSAATMADMKAYAAEIQKQTVIGDEAVLEMMQMGAALGKLSGGGLKDATTAAIGLSRRLSIDTTAAMRLVSRAAVGDTAQLKRYGVVLTEGLSPQEKFNELLRIGADSFKLAQGETETYAGKMKQLSNTWGDMKERIGAALAPMISGIADALKAAIPTIEAWVTGFINGFKWIVQALKPVWDFIVAAFQDWLAVGKVVFDMLGNIFSGFGDTVSGVGDVIGKVFGFLKKYVRFVATAWIYYFTVVETYILNFKVVWLLVWKAIQLGVISFVRDFAHFFGVVIPDLLGWFSRNWYKIFTDLWNGTKAIFSNMYKNVKGFFTAVWSFLKGGGYNWEWTDLLAGYKSTLEEMPRILKRQLGKDETKLKKEIGELGQKLGEEFQKKLKPRLDMLSGAGKPGGKPVADAAKNAVTGAMGAAKATVALDDESKNALKAAGGGGPKSLAAVEARFLTTAPGHNLDKQMAADSRKNVKANERAAKAAEKTAQNTAATAAGGGEVRLVLAQF